MTGLAFIGVVVAIAAAVFGIPHLLVYGFPRVRGRYRVWRIQREWRREVVERALTILLDTPSMPFECEYHTSIFGRACCAMVRAEREMEVERAAINRVIAESLP